MSIEHVLAVVAVTDVDAATAFYQRVFGGPPTNHPMPSLVEWQVTDTGWVQVWVDAERAGRSSVNLAVDDIERAVGELAARGLAPGPVDTVSNGVQLSAISDPDGNVVTLIGNFRPVY
jgi:glyoxylase I family protein